MTNLSVCLKFSSKGLAIMLLFWALRSSGGTFAPDTIDNWQIYNGKELILAGHESPLGTNFHNTIKKDEVGDLEIKFNHCSPHQNLTRTVRITDETGRMVVSKKFSSDTVKMIIHRLELSELTSKFLIIEYMERGNGEGLRRNLGHLIVQDSPEFNLGVFELKREDISEDYRAKIEALRQKRGYFFEDDNYVADKTCSGEWGGTIKFRKKSTGEVRVCSATCPIVVNKINGKYVVTNSLAHLFGSTEILEIATPDSLSILPSTKPGAKKNGKVIRYVGDDESRSKKGTVQMLDSVGVLALGSFCIKVNCFMWSLTFKRPMWPRLNTRDLWWWILLLRISTPGRMGPRF
jgi:hypothetical protein